MKQNKLYSWLTSLLVMVMLALVGQTAMAQDATFDLTSQSANQLTSGDVQVTFNNYSQGANIWGDHYDSYSLKVNGLNDAKISKIEFKIYQMGYAYNTVVLKEAVGTFDYQPTGTSVWTGSASEVCFVGTSSDTDVYVTTLRVWTGGGTVDPTPSDFPKTGVPYQIQEISGGLYLNVFENDGFKDVVLNATPQALYFTTSGTGYIITTAPNGQGLYVGGHNEKDWNMSSKVSQTWNVVPVTGGYALQRTDATSKYIGFNDVTTGGTVSAAFRDKNYSMDHGVFSITEIDLSDKTYTVNVTGNPSAATVTVKGVAVVGGSVTVAGPAIQTDVVATDIAGYEYTVSISGDVITVTYSKLPDYIEFVTSGLSSGSYDLTQNNVRVQGTVYSKMLNIYSWAPGYFTSSDKNIVKIEIECEDIMSGVSGNTGTFDPSINTWTGCSKNVILSASYGDYYITKVRVYLEDLAPKEYTVSITGNPSEAKITYDGTQYADGDTFTATGLTSEAITATAIEGYVYNVTIDGTTIKVEYSEPPSIKIDYVTIGWNTTVASGDQMEKIESVQVYLQDAIDYIDGMPVGMTFTDGAGNEQTISYCYMQGGYDSNWNYIYNGFYFVFNNTITAPGTYTLHIPAGAIKNTTTGLQNNEINFQFVIPTPVEFAAPTLTPAEGTVESLKEFTLTAPTGVTFNTERSPSTITVNGNTQYIYNYEYALDGSSLTFLLNSEYTTDGQAVVVLPQGFVRSTTNEYCPEVTATYTVAYPWYEVSAYSALEPADNSEVKSLSTITISAPTGVTFDCTSEGEERNVTVSLNDEDKEVVANVYADHIVLNYETKTVGSYAFVIPASTFAANSGAKSNKEISFNYTILPTLSVSNVGWTTFCYDHNFTLADGYTPYMIQTAEDGVAEPVEILGAPKTETIKGYINNYNGTPDMQATADGTYITAPCFENKVQVTYGGTMSGGDYFDVGAGAWVEVKGMNGTEVVSVVPRSWDPFSYDSYNFDVSDIEDGIRIEWTGYSYFGGLDINIAIAGEYEKPVIPAGTGILVQGTPAQDITYEKTYAAPSDVTGNILVGCTADEEITNSDYYFYKFSLNKSNEAGSEGFYWGSADGHSISMHAGKAYLILEADDAAGIRGFRLFGEETEGISMKTTDNGQQPVFNLQGQRMGGKLSTGIYVKNGKKVLVK